MKSAFWSVAMSAAALCAPDVLAAELSYRAVDAERSWDMPSAWLYSCSLPTSNDTVKLNDASIAVPDCLRITNNVTARAAALLIGAGASNGDLVAGLKVEQGGTLNLAGSGWYNYFTVGDSGRGSLVIDGGTVEPSGWNLVVGNQSGSYGEVTVNPGSPPFSPAAQGVGRYQKGMIVGFNGIGRFASYADVGFYNLYCGDNASTVMGLELRVGANTSGWSTFFAAGSTVNTFDCQIGGIAYYGEQLYIYNSKTDRPGFGEMVLSNATLKVAKAAPANTDAQLVIGRYEGGYGILRGCGTVQGSSPDSNNLRIWMNQGCIIADGFGEEASLDFNTAISIRNNTAAIAADTTNGWYAVNKGAALFPRVWFDTSSKSTVIGGWSGDTEPGFVNSVGVSVSGVSGVSGSARYLRGGLFAADRSDIHAGELPGGVKVAGVWKIGIADGINSATALGYASASLDFRYDQSKVTAGSTIALCRWNGSSWDVVAEKTADSTHRISVSGLSKPASWDGIYNIGTFAVVQKRSGMSILYK